MLFFKMQSLYESGNHLKCKKNYKCVLLVLTLKRYYQVLILHGSHVYTYDGLFENLYYIGNSYLYCLLKWYEFINMSFLH